MPQMFSQLSHPSPLKNANCRSSVLSRFQRSEILTIVPRLQPPVSIHRRHKLKLILSPSHHIPRDPSSCGPPSGSNASGCPTLSAANENASGTPSCVSPLIPSASICFHEFGDSLRPGHSRIVCTLVPHHHGKQHPHAPAMKVRHHLLDAATPPGIDRIMSCWLRLSIPILG